MHPLPKNVYSSRLVLTLAITIHPPRCCEHHARLVADKLANGKEPKEARRGCAVAIAILGRWLFEERVYFMQFSEFARSAGGRNCNWEFRNPGFARRALGAGIGIGNFGILGLQGALGAGIGIGNFGILRRGGQNFKARITIPSFRV